MGQIGTIFLAGASRGVGWEIAQILRSQNHTVTALLRSPEQKSKLEALGITVVMGDALQPDGVERALCQDAPITQVITTIGGMPAQGQRPDYLGNKHLIDAAVKAGVEHLILITSIGTGDSAGAISEQVMEVLGPVLAEKKKAEDYLTASGLPYTIIRPGGLVSEPATGRGALTTDTRIAGTIHRADVAQLVCQCLGSDKAKNQILSAIDRDLLYTDLPWAEFSLA